MFLQIFMNFDF